MNKNRNKPTEIRLYLNDDGTYHGSFKERYYVPDYKRYHYTETFFKRANISMTILECDNEEDDLTIEFSNY